MMESDCDLDKLKARVEMMLGRLMKVKVSIGENDPRIVSMHQDIRRNHLTGNIDRFPDEEMLQLVKKYFKYRAVVFPQ